MPITTKAPFPKARTCCDCGCSGPVNIGPSTAREPRVLSITPIMYRRGTSKGLLKNARSVHICEPCLIKSLVPFSSSMGIKGSKLWNALRESLSTCYSDMQTADEE